MNADCSRAIVSIAAATAFWLGCGEDVTGPDAVARVEVTPSSATLTAIEEVQDFSARALTSSGQVVQEISFVWSVSDGEVVSVDNTGTVTALSNGTSRVTATVEDNNVRGSAQVTVEQEVAAVSISPSSVELPAFDATQDFQAETQDQNGNPVSGSSVSWSVHPDSVAAVDPSGVATATANGKATVIATVSDVADSAQLVVDQEVAEVSVEPDSATLTAIPDTQTFEAEASDRNGNRVHGTEFSWSVDDPAVASAQSDGIVIAADTGRTKVVAEANGVTDGSPLTVYDIGRTRLVFATDRDGNKEVYTIKPSGEGLRRVTDNSATDGNPAWSPNHDEIVFWSDRSGSPAIYRIDADGSDVKRITDRVSDGSSPTWAPDGSRIAFQSSGGAIATIEPNGAGFNEVFAFGEDPSWSPDSKQILYSADDIRIGARDGSSSERTGVEGFQPRMSPDGSEIAFWDFSTDVDVMDSDGTNVRNIANGSHPSWSPNGKWIAYVHGGDVFLVRADGSAKLQLTDGAASEGGVSWQQ